jgi:hypothetical protein
MTQGKVERYHRTMKNVIKLKNYSLPGALEEEIAAFVEHYNHRRVHESLDNLTPADVYHGRARKIQALKNTLKAQTLHRRRTTRASMSAHGMPSWRVACPSC